MQERGLKGVKIQKLPWGSLPLDPLEACAFGARLGNQSVFILDPRLLRHIFKTFHEAYTIFLSGERIGSHIESVS